MLCFPNPAEEILTFKAENNTLFDTIQIIDMKDVTVSTITKPTTHTINISQLQAGTYIIRCCLEDETAEGKFINK
jgi:hypothetical protein